MVSITWILKTYIKLYNIESKTLRYLNKASYPLYILHLTVMSIFGYVLLSSYPELRYGSRMIKFLLYSSVSLIFTFAIYDLLIKKTILGHILFGLKEKNRKIQ